MSYLDAAMDLPGLAFARFVEDVHTVAPEGQVFEGVRLPDGRASLVFRALDGGRTGDVWVGGPGTHAKFKRVNGITRAVTLRFKPGWSVPLLGVAASELTDRIVPLEDLWGRVAPDLCDQLLAARSHAEVMDRLTRAIALRAGHALDTASGQLARRAVRLLEGGEERVERVAAQLGVTARHLRRAFAENVGVGPKEFARAARLQRAVRMAATSSDWAGIAAAAGYYDQAHLIAEFRQLVGITPGAFFKLGRAPSGAKAREPRAEVLGPGALEA